MTVQAPEGWYADPFRRFESRYWSGAAWTEHVASQGVGGVDPPLPTPLPIPTQAPAPAVAVAGKVNKSVGRDLRRAGVDSATSAGGGTLLTEEVLFVSQKIKLLEVNAEYTIFNQHGHRVGGVREVGNNFAKKAAGVDQLGSKRLKIVDVDGTLLMTLTRPVSILKSTVTVRDPEGGEIGQIVQKNLGLLGRVDFELMVQGATVGSMKGEDWTAWNFGIEDDSRNEVARVSKSWAGSTTEKLFTTKDNYVLQINRPIEGAMRSLVVAAALVIDTVLRQQGSVYRR